MPQSPRADENPALYSLCPQPTVTRERWGELQLLIGSAPEVNGSLSGMTAYMRIAPEIYKWRMFTKVQRQS